MGEVLLLRLTVQVGRLGDGLADAYEMKRRLTEVRKKGQKCVGLLDGLCSREFYGAYRNWFVMINVLHKALRLCNATCCEVKPSVLLICY